MAILSGPPDDCVGSKYGPGGSSRNWRWPMKPCSCRCSRFCFAVIRKSLAVTAWLVSIALTAATRADDIKPPDVMLGLNASGHNGHVTRLVIDRQRSQMISVSHDKTIRFWDLNTFATLRVLRPPIGRGMVGELYSASLSPDGAWLAVSGCTAPEGTTDHAILLISLPEGRLIRRLSGNTLPLQDIAFSPDGRWLAASGSDGILRLWETSTGNLAQALPGHVAQIDALAWSPDGKLLVTASWDGTCRFWSLADGTSTSVVAHGGRKVYCAAWSPDGRSVATGGADHWVKLWEPDGRFRANLVSAPLSLETVSFSPDSSKLLYGFGGSQLKPFAGGLVRLADHAMLASYVGHLETVLCSAFSPDGRFAMMGDCEDHICVWEAETGRLAARLRSEGWPIYATGFSSDGRTIGFGYSHVPGSSLHATNPLTRAFTLDQLQFAPTPDQTFMRAQAQWGGLTIARNSYHQVGVSQFGAPISQYTTQNQTIHSRTLLPGNRAAIGLNQSVIVFDALNGRPIYRLPGHLDDVWSVTPSPDQRHLLTGSDDETMQIWNLERYEHTLSLYVAGDDWVAWTPQGYYAASAGGENLMGWHIQRSFQEMASFYPASRFRNKFYRPDIIRRVLSAGGPMQALKGLEGTGGRDVHLADVGHSLPPKVTLTAEPGDPAVGSKVRVQVVATPVDGDTIRSLKLLVDGRPVAETRDEELLAGTPVPDSVGTGLESRVVWNVPISPGTHRLIAKADSERSIGLSEPLSITMGSPIATIPRLFVLAIGVSGNQRMDLRRTLAATDAQAIGAIFGNLPRRDFSDIQVRVVADPLVTRFNLEEGFRWLQNTMQSDDVGVVYFAGRTLRDQHDLIYFQHQESRFGDPAAGLSASALRDYLKHTAGQLLLVLDVIERDEASQAAPISTVPATSMPTERRSITDLVRELANDDNGVAVLALTSSGDVAADSSGASPFARSMIDGLSGKADTNGDRLVDVKELLRFVRNDVKQRTNGNQNPIAAIPTLTSAFPLARGR